VVTVATIEVGVIVVMIDILSVIVIVVKTEVLIVVVIAAKIEVLLVVTVAAIEARRLEALQTVTEMVDLALGHRKIAAESKTTEVVTMVPVTKGVEMIEMLAAMLVKTFVMEPAMKRIEMIEMPAAMVATTFATIVMTLVNNMENSLAVAATKEGGTVMIDNRKIEVCVSVV
jgi:hypothetical protein